jgi:hypothetical protein
VEDDQSMFVAPKGVMVMGIDHSALSQPKEIGVRESGRRKRKR